MIIINTDTDKGSFLPLGRQLEHGVREVWFDLTWLIENVGEGTAVLVYQRSKDVAPYVVTTQLHGNVLVWTVGDADTAYDGFGKAEIRWTVDENLAKTVTYRTNVLSSITAGEDVPEPLESWYDQMLEQIGDSQEYAQQAAAAAQAAGASAGRAEQAAEAIESAAVVLTASNSGGGIVTINASINRG